MTELLFQTDSYVKTFDATILEIDSQENAIVLDRTAFYPGGGGQPNDSGIILVDGASLAVTRLKSQGGKIWHWLDGELPAIGTKIKGEIDWDRRFKLMRTHTALHVLCGVVWRDYGAHQSPVGSLSSWQSAVSSPQSPVGSPHLTTSKLQTVD